MKITTNEVTGKTRLAREDISEETAMKIAAKITAEFTFIEIDYRVDGASVVFYIDNDFHTEGLQGFAGGLIKGLLMSI